MMYERCNYYSSNSSKLVGILWISDKIGMSRGLLDTDRLIDQTINTVLPSTRNVGLNS